jgi:hypothetical protein
MTNPPADHLTQNGNLRQARADVIVQVSSNADTDAFQFEQLSQPITVDGIDHKTQGHCCQS